MPKMVSLKLSKKQMEEKGKRLEQPEKYPYPWGTSIALEIEQIQALGLDSVEVGQKFSLSGIAVVESVSAAQDAQMGKSQSVQLQITDLGLENEGGGRKEFYRKMLKE